MFGKFGFLIACFNAPPLCKKVKVFAHMMRVKELYLSLSQYIYFKNILGRQTGLIGPQLLVGLQLQKYKKIKDKASQANPKNEFFQGEHTTLHLHHAILPLLGLQLFKRTAFTKILMNKGLKSINQMLIRSRILT